MFVGVVCVVKGFVVCVSFYLFDVDSMVSLRRELRVYTTIHTIFSLFLQGVWLGWVGRIKETAKIMVQNNNKNRGHQRN